MQDSSLLAGLTVKVVLVWHQIHAAWLFTGMWEFTCVKTEKPSDYCLFVILTVGS